MASSHEVVAEALRTSLAAIVADGTYNYTPDLVGRVTFWPDESALDTSLDTVYLVQRIARSTRPYDGHRLDSRTKFRVLCCHRFTEPSERPGVSDPVREQIADNMEADVIRKLWSDVRLGQPGIVIDCLQEPIETTFDYSVQWVVCAVDVTVRYQHPQDDA